MLLRKLIAAIRRSAVIQQRDSWVWFKVNGLSRYLLVHLASGAIPLYTVNEFPKSGGTWLAQMLAKALEIPFPRNRLPALGSAVMHGHYLRRWGMKNVVVVWRDGRDALVSLYFHALFENDGWNARLVRAVRRDLPFSDYADIGANMPRFIEYAFERKRHPRFSWSDFVEHWYGRPSVTYVRYRDLLQNAPEELRRIVRALTGRELSAETALHIADEFSFQRQAGRPRGQEVRRSFLRKGVAGDWRNHFSLEARQLFDHYAGDALIQLGYERDHAWVDEGHGSLGMLPGPASRPADARVASA